MSDYPKPCVSTKQFAAQFPATLKRAGVVRLTGFVLGEARQYQDCYNVKWNELRKKLRLHKSFFRVLPPSEDDQESKHA